MDWLDLAPHADERCESFSKGMRQKVALAGALVHEPRVIILDEPLTGLDAGSARQVKNVLRERTRAGGTIIMTTHILEVAERMADRIGIIAHGRLIAEGTLEELRRQAGTKPIAARATAAASRIRSSHSSPSRRKRHDRQAGTAVWFAQHESRLVWRDWLSMITAGRRERLRMVAIGVVAFIVFMHFVAYWVVGPHADAAIDKQTLLTITTSALLSWMLMISQAMESITRAFYARSDLDLILASPVDSNKLFGVRIATIALGTTMMALPLAAPFIDVLIARGGWRWLGAYGLIVAMGAAATALAVGLTVALFRVLGARRTRFVAQVVAAVIGAAFVIGLQVVAILSYGTISRAALLQSKTLLALAPGLDSVLWWPARAALGEMLPLDRRARHELGAPRRRDRGRRAAVRQLRHRGRRGRQRRAWSVRDGMRFAKGSRRAARCAARNGSCCGAIHG